jgi:hypothetical protein
MGKSIRKKYCGEQHRQNDNADDEVRLSGEVGFDQVHIVLHNRCLKAKKKPTQPDTSGVQLRRLTR